MKLQYSQLEIIGLPDEYGKAGSYKNLLEDRGLTANSIANKIDQQFSNGSLEHGPGQGCSARM